MRLGRRLAGRAHLQLAVRRAAEPLAQGHCGGVDFSGFFRPAPGSPTVIVIKVWASLAGREARLNLTLVPITAHLKSRQGPVSTLAEAMPGVMGTLVPWRRDVCPWPAALAGPRWPYWAGAADLAETEARAPSPRPCGRRRGHSGAACHLRAFSAAMAHVVSA